MSRKRGSGTMGPTRSMRLPRALDEWFVERLERDLERSPSEVLVQLVHGGLRLREGYMAIHRRELERIRSSGDGQTHAGYLRCLGDTFGPEYVAHLEKWIASDEKRAFAPSRAT
jgi:hypothetical protein